MQLKAQTKTHPSGSQSGRSAAIPLRSRSQTTPPRHPLPRSAQHLRALGPRPLPLPRLRTAPALRAPRAARWARLLPLPRLRAAPVPRAGSPAPTRWALPRSRALGAAPLARPLPALRPARARAAAREGGADLGLDFSEE